jgi:hypothetical protein
MCCAATIYPAPENWPEVLRLAGFLPAPNTTPLTLAARYALARYALARYAPLHDWLREVADGRLVLVVVRLGPKTEILFRLLPSIGPHTYANHLENAASAAVMFKTLMALAELGSSRVYQHSLMGRCNVGNDIAMPSRKLAHYPHEPLRFENLCLGFREALLSGVPQLNE